MSFDDDTAADRLAAIRRRVRRLVWWSGLSLTLTALFGSLLVAGGLDWLVRLDDVGLRVLLAAPRRVLTRERLIELSRGYDDDVFDRSVDVQILRLRRKLETEPSRPQLIRTERGLGYFFDARVEAVY